MNTLKAWIERMADGEAVEAVFIGEMGWSDYNEPEGVDYKAAVGWPLTWEQAQPYINYEFDNGYGAPGCNAIVAYTKSWIIFVGQYDGATWPERLPRNPVDYYVPPMIGGG